MFLKYILELMEKLENCENKKNMDLPSLYVRVTRPVQKLVLLLPVDEDTSATGGGSVSAKVTNTVNHLDIRLNDC